MDARTPRSRARARALRATLSGVSALVLLAAVALPVGFSPSGVEPFQKTAHAKGGGPGAAGPPDHSSAGGNGNGHGNGHGGGLTSTGHDGEDGHEKDKLGKFNAANASLTGLRNANPDSTVGQLYLYKQKVEGMVEGEEITDFDGAKKFLEPFANKELTLEVVNALNELLDLPLFEEPDPEE